MSTCNPELFSKSRTQGPKPHSLIGGTRGTKEIVVFRLRRRREGRRHHSFIFHDSFREVENRYGKGLNFYKIRENLSRTSSSITLSFRRWESLRLVRWGTNSGTRSVGFPPLPSCCLGRRVAPSIGGGGGSLKSPYRLYLDFDVGSIYSRCSCT